MKSSRALPSLLVIILSLLFTYTANSQTEHLFYDGTSIALDLNKNRPKFPREAKQIGYTEGFAVLSIELDHNGEVRDWLVIDSLHPSFAQAVANVIEEWNFYPPISGGKPVSVVFKLSVHFKRKGGVVNLDGYNAVQMLLQSRFGTNQIDREKVVPVLTTDNLPELSYIIRPNVPKSIFDGGGETIVMFNFYIDKEGKVRMVALNEAEKRDIDPRALLRVQDALQQWEFDPITRRGHPVIVKVIQPIIY